MNRRINEMSIYRNSVSQKSDLYTRFKPAFERLLRLNDFRNNSPKGRELYIPDEELDKELDDILRDNADSLSILIGYAGIGKSTSLRNYFNYTNSVPEYQADKKILIFPASYNGCVNTEVENELSYDIDEKSELAQKVREDMTLRIESINSYLEEKYEELKRTFDSEEGQMEFYQYLRKTNAHVLEHVPYNERRKLSKKEEIMKRLEYACEKEKFICAATRLKYYLGKDICECEKVIVILDDIEPLPYAQQKVLIMQYARLFECLKNTCRELSNKEYVVNVIIGMRPHTYRIMKEYRAFKAFYINNEILKRNMVDIGKLFQKKIEIYEDEIPHENIDSWNSAKRAVGILSNKFHSRYAEMIKNLSIWNTREAMDIYKRVLENRVWVQKNIEKASSFVINVDDYIFNNITVLRAIACRNNYVYKHYEGEIVPNILYSTPERNYGFLCMCVFACFHMDEKVDYAYGTESISYAELLNRLVTSFTGYQSIEEDAKKVINYLFINKLLRKSINDTDKLELLDKEESLKEDSLLYLSPRGFEIWRMIESDSVYMELCREDCYRNYDETEKNSESSYELFLNGQQDVIFKDLLGFLYELLDEEMKYINFANENHTIDIYKGHFGSHVMFKRFYTGIKRSIEFSGYLGYSSLNENLEKVEEKIYTIESFLKTT